MPRGILTIEQKQKQLDGIRNPENKKRISERMKEMWKTKDMTERNKKVSIARLGSKHPLWKGDEVGYDALHSWVRANYKIPLLCQKCNKKKKLEACNISGKYLREESDWEWLCRKCHMISDGRLQKLIDSNKNYEETN